MRTYIFLFALFVSSIFFAQEKLPVAEVTNTDGKKIQLLDKIDKLTLIDYWATWCKPCIEEMPYLEEIKEKYNDKLDIVSISVDSHIKLWEKYFDKMKHKENQYWVEDKNPIKDLIIEEVEDTKGVKSITFYLPRFFLINKDGEIISKECPQPSSGDLENLIDKHLKG